jgi:hypothetical protein
VVGTFTGRVDVIAALSAFTHTPAMGLPYCAEDHRNPA